MILFSILSTWLYFLYYSFILFENVFLFDYGLVQFLALLYGVFQSITSISPIMFIERAPVWYHVQNLASSDLRVTFRFSESFSNSPAMVLEWFTNRMILSMFLSLPPISINRKPRKFHPVELTYSQMIVL